MSSGVADRPESGRPSAAGELAWHTLSAEEVLRSEGANAQRGLSSAEAASRARRFGPNKLAAAKAEPSRVLRPSGGACATGIDGCLGPRGPVVSLSCQARSHPSAAHGIAASSTRQARSYVLTWAACSAPSSGRTSSERWATFLFPVKETNYGHIRDERPWSAPMGRRFAEIIKGLSFLRGRDRDERRKQAPPGVHGATFADHSGGQGRKITRWLRRSIPGRAAGRGGVPRRGRSRDSRAAARGIRGRGSRRPRRPELDGYPDERQGRGADVRRGRERRRRSEHPRHAGASTT